MKRYNKDIKTFSDGSFETDIVEDPNGKWVKWEDHIYEFFKFREEYEKQINKLQDEINRLQDVVFECNECESLRGPQIEAETIYKVQDVTKCNCSEMAQHCYAELGDYWICPKHGYKKR